MGLTNQALKSTVPFRVFVFFLASIFVKNYLNYLKELLWLGFGFTSSNIVQCKLQSQPLQAWYLTICERASLRKMVKRGQKYTVRLLPHSETLAQLVTV